MINFREGKVTDYTREIPDNTYDAVFSDPPYSLGKDPDPVALLSAWLQNGEYDWGRGFMGKDWDGIPGPETWRELLRVTKPGGYLAVFGGTRTEDWLSVACRLGGWQRFDRIEWVYSSGFPKSHNISKAIDKAAGVTGKWGDYKTKDHAKKRKPGNERMHDGYQRPWRDNPDAEDRQARQYLPAAELAKSWDGYGTALAPSHEPIILFRKPTDGTYANNAETWGCGGLNIEGSRIPITDNAIMARNNKYGSNGWKNSSGGPNSAAINGNPSGRWPKNLIIDGSDEVNALFPQTGISRGGRKKSTKNGVALKLGQDISAEAARGDPGYGDQGSAARFFYQAKASPSERHAGLDDIPAAQRDHSRNADQPSQNNGDGNPYNRGAAIVKNSHPTVKPLELCEYIAYLLLPPPAYRSTARILIPFAGSGSEAIGAMLADWENIDAVELLAEHLEIARLRAVYWEEQKRAFDRASSQLSLFD